MCLKIKVKHHNIMIIQVYAPNEIAEETRKLQFYEELRETIKETIKPKDQWIVMGVGFPSDQGFASFVSYCCCYAYIINLLTG